MLIENALYIFFNSMHICKCQHVAAKVLLKWFICNFFLTFKLHWILMPCKKKRCKGLRRLFSVTLCLSRNTSIHSYTHVTKLYYKNHTYTSLSLYNICITRSVFGMISGTGKTFFYGYSVLTLSDTSVFRLWLYHQ